MHRKASKIEPGLSPQKDLLIQNILNVFPSRIRNYSCSLPKKKKKINRKKFKIWSLFSDYKHSDGLKVETKK